MGSSANGSLAVTNVTCGGIPYSADNLTTDIDGKVYLYLPAGADGAELVKLTVNGKVYGKFYVREANTTYEETLAELPQYAFVLNKTGTHNFGTETYGYTAPELTVKVTNTGYDLTGNLTVALSGDNTTSFTAPTTISPIAAAGTGEFMVTPNAELAAGTYTATVKVWNSNISEQTFDVSFTVNQKDVTATLTAAGKVYDGTDDATLSGTIINGRVGNDDVGVSGGTAIFDSKDAGSRTVSFSGYSLSGAAKDNYNLTAQPADTQADITAAPVSVDWDNTALTYTGSPQTPTATAAGVGSDGPLQLTVSGAQTNAGTGYTATAYFTNSERNYTLNNTSQTFEITAASLLPSQLAFDFPVVTYNGSLQGIPAPTLRAPLTGKGEITVMYNGLATVPTDAGRYAVTVDVRNIDANHADALGLALDTFEIAKAVPTAEHLNITANTYVYYTGDPQAIDIPTLRATYAGLGEVTVKYNGIATVPTNAGVDVRNIDANQADTLGLALDTFEIAKAAPTAEHPNITANTYVYHTGDPQTVDVPTLRATYAGPGDMTVKNSGSDRPPVYPGEYAITLDIAEGTNFAAVNDLPAGRLVISEPPTPSLPRRVTIERAEHFDLYPSPGIYHVESREDMDITLTPRATLPTGYVPQVTTGRVILPDDQSGNIRITANADGTYTVRIFYIIEEVVVTVTAVPDDDTGSEQPAVAPRVWSHGRRLYIAAPSTSGRAYIYNVSGRLVKIVSHAAGETVVTQLPEAGIYVVVVEGRSYLIIAD